MFSKYPNSSVFVFEDNGVRIKTFPLPCVERRLPKYNIRHPHSENPAGIRWKTRTRFESRRFWSSSSSLKIGIVVVVAVVDDFWKWRIESRWSSWREPIWVKTLFYNFNMRNVQIIRTTYIKLFS
jgi:hypothetical protein